MTIKDLEEICGIWIKSGKSLDSFLEEELIKYPEDLQTEFKIKYNYIEIPNDYKEQERECNHTSQLTPAQWKLYNFIKQISIDGKVTTIAEICDMFPNEYHLNGKECNYTNCPTIYEDIHIINSSYEIEKYIITDNNNIHLANKEELEKEIDSKEKKLEKLSKELKVMRRKKALNNQMKCISLHGDVIDEKSKARNYVETYLKDLDDDDLNF